MTTAAIIIACFISGYFAGSVTGFFIGVEYESAPIIEDTESTHPAIISMEYIDEVSGDYIQNSCSVYIEDRPDGSARQFIIQNN